jgi:DNA-binding MarR family transcriptional regulator
VTDRPVSSVPVAQETLVDAFWAVARQLRHRTRDTVEPYGVTPGQTRALTVLAWQGGIRSGALAEHLHIAPRSGTEVVDALEERGLVHRSPDPDDRRATMVTLTAAGERVAAEVLAAQRTEAERFFGTLPRADQVELARILTVLREGS